MFDTYKFYDSSGKLRAFRCSQFERNSEHVTLETQNRVEMQCIESGERDLTWSRFTGWAGAEVRS